MAQFPRATTVKPLISDEQKENIKTFINDWQSSVDVAWQDVDFSPFVTTVTDALSDHILTKEELTSIVTEAANLNEALGITPEESRTLWYDFQDIAEASRVTRTDDWLTGTTGNDILWSGLGNDVLIGVGTETSGTGEVDTLLGGGGNDTFMLGNATNAFYSDNKSWTAGMQDYALIVDFNLAQDIIQLHGSANDYILGALPADSGMNGTGIFYQPTDSLATPELIGVVAGVQLTDFSAGFSFA